MSSHANTVVDAPHPNGSLATLCRARSSAILCRRFCFVANSRIEPTQDARLLSCQTERKELNFSFIFFILWTFWSKRLCEIKHQYWCNETFLFSFLIFALLVVFVFGKWISKRIYERTEPIRTNGRWFMTLKHDIWIRLEWMWFTDSFLLHFNGSIELENNPGCETGQTTQQRQQQQRRRRAAKECYPFPIMASVLVANRNGHK